MSGVISVLPTHQFTYNGEPVAAGTLDVYLANTVTRSNSWKDKAQTVLNANPIVLDAQGECELWLDASLVYDLVLKDSLGTVLNTYEDVSGAASSAITVSEWTVTGIAPTYLSATSFSMSGNQTAVYHAGRRVKATVSGGARYGTILSSVFSTVTTVTLAIDGGLALDNTLSSVDVGVVSAQNPSYLQDARGADITITASGNITLPAAGGYFVLTGTGFSVTGLSSLYNGRSVTLKFPAGLTLTHSASFVLAGGISRVTQAGEVIDFVNESSGVWVEKSVPYVAPGYASYWSITATTTLDYRHYNGLMVVSGNIVFVNIPNATTVPAGTKLTFRDNNTTGGLAIVAPSVQIVGGINGTVSTLGLLQYDTVELTCTGTVWLITGGTFLLKESNGIFARVPSSYCTLFGSIVAFWGTATTSATAPVAVALPVTLSVAPYITCLPVSTTSVSVTTQGINGTGFNVNGWNPATGARVAVGVHYFGIGPV